jgi:hypothetical protein
LCNIISSSLSNNPKLIQALNEQFNYSKDISGDSDILSTSIREKQVIVILNKFYSSKTNDLKTKLKKDDVLRITPHLTL